MKRIAVVSNWQSERCGIQAFGEDLGSALVGAGFRVDGRLWTEASSQDYTIYNWHPHTADVWFVPEGPCTVIAHEVPPHVEWPSWFIRPDVWVLVGEPYAEFTQLHYPILDYESPCYPVKGAPFKVGITGLRGDGVDLIRQVCGKNQWEFSHSPTDRFASRQEEIDRLASCDVIALWYWATGRARSLALSVALAARRPLLLSQSTMLDTAKNHFLPQLPWTDDLDTIAEYIKELPHNWEVYERGLHQQRWHRAIRFMRERWREDYEQEL